MTTIQDLLVMPEPALRRWARDIALNSVRYCPRDREVGRWYEWLALTLRSTSPGFLWYFAVKICDDAIDDAGADRLRGGLDRKRYMIHLQRMMDVLCEKRTRPVRVVPTDVLFVAALRAANGLGCDVRPLLVEMWRNIRCDAARQSAGQTFPSRRVQTIANRTTVAYLTGTVWLLGCNYPVARLCAHMMMPLFLATDTVADFPADVRQHCSHAIAEELQQAGVDLQRASLCTSWHDVADYRPLAAWYHRQAQNALKAWSSDQAKARLRALAAVDRPGRYVMLAWARWTVWKNRRMAQQAVRRSRNWAPGA